MLKVAVDSAEIKQIYSYGPNCVLDAQYVYFLIYPCGCQISQLIRKPSFHPDRLVFAYCPEVLLLSLIRSLHFHLSYFQIRNIPDMELRAFCRPPKRRCVSRATV
jgi:hypothetical protein